MRNILANCRKNPSKKIADIQRFSEKLFRQKPLVDWGIIVQSMPVKFESYILTTPQLSLSDGTTSFLEPDTLRKLPIYKPMHLLY